MSDADEEAWAAGRDASWYIRPDVRSSKKIHLAGTETREGVGSRCGRSILDTSLRWDPTEVPVNLRCQRSGCRENWPK